MIYCRVMRRTVHWLAGDPEKDRARVRCGFDLPPCHGNKHERKKEEVMDDATLFRIVEALVDECPETLFSEQLAGRVESQPRC